MNQLDDTILEILRLLFYCCCYIDVAFVFRKTRFIYIMMCHYLRHFNVFVKINNLIIYVILKFTFDFSQ